MITEEEKLDVMLAEQNIMTVFRSKHSDGSVSYTERDGDVGYSLIGPGQWELRATDLPEPRLFNTYYELEEFILENWKLAGIIVFK